MLPVRNLLTVDPNRPFGELSHPFGVARNQPRGLQRSHQRLARGVTRNQNLQRQSGWQCFLGEASNEIRLGLLGCSGAVEARYEEGPFALPWKRATISLASSNFTSRGLRPPAIAVRKPSISVSGRNDNNSK